MKKSGSDLYILMISALVCQIFYRHEFGFPIDLLFNSLAKKYGQRAIGVILSGTGSDGACGLRAIAEAGGMTLVQAPETAKFAEMPNSAIATGIVDLVLPPIELAQLIHQRVVSSLDSATQEISKNELLSQSRLQEIADLLVNIRGIDFAFYKTTTISRRIHHRRLVNQIENIASYIDLLRKSPAERQVLVADLLINVTRYVSVKLDRDREAQRHILDFSKITADKLHLEPQGFDLRQFLADISTIFQLRAQKKGLTFEMQISPDVPLAVKADITRLRQVLYNLLSNAVKFTNRGSVVLKISATKSAQDKDDHPNNLKLIAEYLSSDCKILIAQTGSNAIETANYYHRDLILLDILMDDVD